MVSRGQSTVRANALTTSPRGNHYSFMLRWSKKRLLWQGNGMLIKFLLACFDGSDLSWGLIMTILFHKHHHIKSSSFSLFSLLSPSFSNSLSLSFLSHKYTIFLSFTQKEMHTDPKWKLPQIFTSLMVTMETISFIYCLLDSWLLVYVILVFTTKFQDGTVSDRSPFFARCIRTTSTATWNTFLLRICHFFIFMIQMVQS